MVYFFTLKKEEKDNVQLLLQQKQINLPVLDIFWDSD